MDVLHYQKVEDELLAQELSKQKALDAERERVAEMQRRQREQEQFSAFEEMIRRQDLEKERQSVLLEFSTPAHPSSEMPLIPGIRGPPVVSPTLPQIPRDNSGGTQNQFNHTPSNNSATGPPSVDRSLKPGTLVSPGSNSE